MQVLHTGGIKEQITELKTRTIYMCVFVWVCACTCVLTKEKAYMIVNFFCDAKVFLLTQANS